MNEEKPKPYIELGRLVRKRRDAQAMSQRDLAKIAGIASGYLNRIEQGYNRPKPPKLKRLAESLALEYEDLAILAGYVRTLDGDVEIRAPKDKAGIIQRLIMYPTEWLDAIERTGRIQWLEARDKPQGNGGRKATDETEDDSQEEAN